MGNVVVIFEKENMPPIFNYLYYIFTQFFLTYSIKK